MIPVWTGYTPTSHRPIDFREMSSVYVDVDVVREVVIR